MTADSPAQLLVAISVGLKCHYFRTSPFLNVISTVSASGRRKERTFFIFFHSLVLLLIVPCSLLASPLPQLLSSSFSFFSSPMSSSRGALRFDRGDPESRLPRKLPQPADVLLADQRGEGLQHHFVL